MFLGWWKLLRMIWYILRFFEDIPKSGYTHSITGRRSDVEVCTIMITPSYSVGFLWTGEVALSTHSQKNVVVFNVLRHTVNHLAIS